MLFLCTLSCNRMTPKPKRTSDEANTELVSQRPGNPVIGKKTNLFKTLLSKMTNSHFIATYITLFVYTDLELEYRR